MMDIEKKKISTSLKSAFIGLCGAVVFVWYVSGYMSSVDLMKIHLKEHPARIAKYGKIISDQSVLNKTWELEIKSEKEHRERLEHRFDRLLRQLERLQLVASNELNIENLKPAGDYDKNKRPSENIYD